MTKLETEVAEFFKLYLKTINDGGIEGVSEYYHEPSLVISPAGIKSLASKGELADLFNPLVEEMKAQGFDHSEFMEMNYQVLSDNAAIGSTLAVRYKGDGSELSRTAVTYTLFKNSHGWKVATLMLHDADKVIEMC
jgi:ketosteroid isomerase-like protein